MTHKNIKTRTDNNLYDSGLNRQDWYVFCNILILFLDAKNKNEIEIEIPQVSKHLINHPFMEAIKVFKDTGNEEFLDKAGKCLIPSTKEPFGWYVAVTKS